MLHPPEDIDRTDLPLYRESVWKIPIEELERNLDENNGPPKHAPDLSEVERVLKRTRYTIATWLSLDRQEKMIKDIKDLMDNNLSFSKYWFQSKHAHIVLEELQKNLASDKKQAPMYNQIGMIQYKREEMIAKMSLTAQTRLRLRLAVYMKLGEDVTGEVAAVKRQRWGSERAITILQLLLQCNLTRDNPKCSCEGNMRYEVTEGARLTVEKDWTVDKQRAMMTRLDDFLNNKKQHMALQLATDNIVEYELVLAVLKENLARPNPIQPESKEL